MTDSTTALAQVVERVLDPGERYLAGLSAHPVPGEHAPPAGDGSEIVRTGFGGLVMGELIDSYRSAAALPQDADEVPSGYHFWVALTSTRLLFFEGGLLARLGSRLAPEGTPGALSSAIELAQLLACDPAPAPGEERLELCFADGSRAQLICAHAGEADAFRAAFAAAKAAPGS